jgi:hypothetical protein
MLLEAFENSEFRIVNQLYAFEQSEFNYSPKITCYENSEFRYIQTLQAYENSEFFCWIPSIYDSITFTTPDTEYLQYVQPSTYFNLVFSDGTNYSPWVKSLRFVKTLGAKTYCELEMIEYGDGNITDFINDIGSGLAGDKVVSAQPTVTNPIFASYCAFPLKYHGFSSARYFNLDISVGYPGQPTQAFRAPLMSPSSMSFDGTTLKMRLEDFTFLLEKENQNMSPDIDADNDVKRSAHTVTKEICSQYGLPNVVLTYPDYLIRLLRRTQGRPIDWLDKISNIYRAKRSFVGNTLKISPILTADEQAIKWNLIGHKHIIDDSFQFSFDIGSYKNKFTIIRTSSNGGIVGSQKCVGYDCVGRTGNINFDIPVNYASATYTVESGTLENFVYRTSTGAIVGAGTPGVNSPSGTAIQSAEPVANVQFTYRARIGATPLQQDGATNSAQNFQGVINNLGMYEYLPEYEVIYRGGKNGASSGIDLDYKFSAEDTAGIACLGLHEEYGDIEDPIIPNSAVAQAYVAALLKESTRKVFSLSFDSPFVNPFIEPGDCIGVTDFETHQENMKWLCEEVSISIEGNDSLMSLTLSRGRT